jgi:signal transduction histidine kinase
MMETQDLPTMTPPTSPPSPHSGTSVQEAARGLARLVVKAHAASAPAATATVARELLASLMAGSGAACGALVVTHSGLGAHVSAVLPAARVLAAHGVDAKVVPPLLSEREQPHDDHTEKAGRHWAHATIPLDAQPLQSDDAQQRGAGAAYLLLAWDGANAAERQVRGRIYMSMLRDAIAAVVVSVLAAEHRFELERAAGQRTGDHLNAELLGTVSHELRSPLAAIKGYASTLLRHERRLPREERHEFLIAIDEATIRLETIINRLLEVSKLEMGDAALDRFAMDLVPVVREAIVGVRPTTEVVARMPVTMSLRILDASGDAADHEPLILADPLAMREVLDHLLENAVKYSPQGGEIAVTLRPAPRGSASTRNRRAPEHAASDGDFLELTVSDQGVGIPDEHLGRIFDRFHRVDTRLTREVDGLGLGLAICSRLVELHGGAIWAESRAGEGSDFHVLLPVATRADE